MPAFQHNQAVLSDPTSDAAAKAVAYCWLLHLVGDIHQPLHTTALFSVKQFPKGDRGGNEIPLTHGRNLHALWDNLLGRRHRLQDVDREVAELSDRERFGDVWDSAGREIDIDRWAAEGRQLAESVVYAPVILEAVRATPEGANVAPIELPKAYLTETGFQARRRIIAAGLRLGAVLKETAGQAGQP